jgi:predicted MPP superfamily phosphohydrolase
MDPEGLIEEVEKILEKEPRLIELPSHGKGVFVGDTHGDLNASEEVIHRFSGKDYIFVFLGDYVDRGALSVENILYLLRQKLEHPNGVFLLAGNHEGYGVKQFYPANFWDSLTPKERAAYSRLFSKFPLAATSARGILALHGGLPDLNSLSEVNGIEWGGPHWERIV